MQTIQMLGVAALVLAPAAATAGYLEDWDTDPPGSNDWFYFSGSPGDDTHMLWVGSGGNPGGYVETPTEQTTDWGVTDTVRDHYVAYAYGDTSHSVGGVPVQSHPINLLTNNRIGINIATATGVSLSGGSLYFWIGEYVGDAADPAADDWSFFAFDQALGISVGSWGEEQVLHLVPNSAAWLTIADNQGKSPADLLSDPQQYGFAIIGGSAAPSGSNLAFDNFSTAPAPAAAPAPPTWLLLAGGLLAHHLRGRSRRTR